MRNPGYFISRKEGVIVIGFTKDLSRDSRTELEECRIQIDRLPFRRAILDLRGVSTLNIVALPAFARLLATIRQIAEVRLCEVQDPVAQLLHEQALICENEISEDLFSSLKDCPLGLQP